MAFLPFGTYEKAEDQPFQSACQQHSDSKEPMQFAGKNETYAQENDSHDRVTCDDPHSRSPLSLIFCSFDLGTSVLDSSVKRNSLK
ncbi:hypothetical protein [Rhizobium leguminosarum]|uniref:hypothetical protein n=1 Tax=Rhizobium leguminosarum TaxID=384 RepID=UPI0013DC05DC|nr:hypothetical protein [Rhizobium leguminosarum]NEK34918.1 hypothetical protein [Rhizobium leguminosarum]